MTTTVGYIARALSEMISIKRYIGVATDIIYQFIIKAIPIPVISGRKNFNKNDRDDKRHYGLHWQEPVDLDQRYLTTIRTSE